VRDADEVARSAAVIFSMVRDDAALAAVASSEDGILSGLAPGKVWVDMSTVSPGAARMLAERVGRLGAAMLSAPVSGSVPAAEEGSLEIMAGGDQRVLDRVEPLLRELGRHVIWIGTNDQALLMKIAINVSLAEQMLAFSEGVLLAERGGIDRQVAVDVLAASAIGSPMLKARAPLVVHLPRYAWFDVALMQKDLRLALDAADTLDVRVPGAEVANEVLKVAQELGYAERDLAALFEVLTKIAGRTKLQSLAADVSNGPRGEA